MDKKLKLEISVIIPTRNRVELLQKTLTSIYGQTLSTKKFELLVIDNGSTDETKQVCESFRAKFPNFQYLYEPQPGLHRGRHMGLKAAQGEILTYADDDIEAFPNWLSEIHNTFQINEQIALVGGKNLPKWESEPPYWLWKLWNAPNQGGNHILGHLSLLDLGEEGKIISPYNVFGCNFSIRKSVLNEAGGFHPDGMPLELIRYRGDGETHVSNFIENSKKYKAFYHPGASVYHFVPNSRMTYEYFAQRSFNQGISDSFTQLKKQPINNQRPRQSLLSKIYKLGKIVLGIEQYRTLKAINESLHGNELQRIIKQNHQEGYAYHQAWYKKDPKLQDWVNRPNYLNENGKI